MELVGPDAIDLGGGHWARLFREGEDLNGQPDGVAMGPTAGFFHVHPSKGGADIPEGEPCAGTVTFGDPGYDSTGRAHWQLHSLDPLHVEPSILCSCGRHGFVRNGRWQEC